MATPGYVELHAASAFSFLRGASSPQQLAEAAAACDLPALALLDRNGFYGSPRLQLEGERLGVRALVGAELMMEDDSVLPVLVRDREGYTRLSQLLTRVHLSSAKGEGRVPWEDLEGNTEGWVVLSGGREGPWYRAWERGEARGIEELHARCRRLFARDCFWVELQRHSLRGESRYEQWIRQRAAEEGWKVVATNEVCYADERGRAVADVFTCLREGCTLDRAGVRLQHNAERMLKGPGAMARLFADCPEAVANSVALAAELAFSIRETGYRFPDYPVPEGESMDSFLRKITWFGAEHRYGSLTPEVRAQIERELALIEKLGFSGYFLIVWDIVNYCRENRIMVQGRGSAANSAVCYSLGITAVDPVGSKLLFERFLSESRQGWPDIDLDLPSGTRREAVIQEVYRRYGSRGAAMTANVITYRARGAVREAGKVLGFGEAVLDRFSRLAGGGEFRDTMTLGERLAAAGIDPVRGRGRVLHHLVQRMIGLPRHLGQHSGGMVICGGMLDRVVPLERASMKGRVVVQWDKDDCEALGIVKVDLLGLGMMAALQDALECCRQRGKAVDLARIPKDDGPTYDLLCAADTMGVFQVESRAQMATLPRMKPRVFYDLVVEVAIIRPGPIVGELTHPYLERRAGRQPVSYPDDRLRPILERTLGVPLFQEQVLKMAMVMAGFSGTEAEELRRAMSFHRSDERMERVKVKLESAMQERGVSPEVRDFIIQSIGSFALYGFPESHAISFALLAYGSAYLKVHHPAEFYAALLNNQPMGFYRPASLIQDGHRHGLRFLPVAVEVSDGACRVVDDRTIRLGFGYLRGFSAKGARRILSERERAPFQSLNDFRRRTRLSGEDLRVLALAGALNQWVGHRRRALWEVEQPQGEGGLDLLWNGEDGGGSCPLEPMTPEERIRTDLQHTGVTVGPHPMALIRDQLPEVWRASELVEAREGQRVKIAGAVTCRQRPGTAKGVFFISLEDETGVANAVVWPDLFERHRLLWSGESFLSIVGVVGRSGGVINVRAESVAALDTRLPGTGSHDFH